MTDPVGTHHVGGVLQDSPTVCGSPCDHDNDRDDEGGRVTVKGERDDDACSPAIPSGTTVLERTTTATIRPTV